MKKVFTGLIKTYQLILSPVLGNRCRFEPSCSNYALQAIDRHGTIKGAYLSVKRLLRCQPLANAGYDPVPETLKSNSSQGTS